MNGGREVLAARGEQQTTTTNNCCPEQRLLSSDSCLVLLVGSIHSLEKAKALETALRPSKPRRPHSIVHSLTQAGRQDISGSCKISGPPLLPLLPRRLRRLVVLLLLLLLLLVLGLVLLPLLRDGGPLLQRPSRPFFRCCRAACLADGHRAHHDTRRRRSGLGAAAASDRRYVKRTKASAAAGEVTRAPLRAAGAQREAVPLPRAVVRGGQARRRCRQAEH